MKNTENKPALVVLAAGMGSRYGGLKQLDQFGPNGESIIDYSIYDALDAGFGKIVFIIRDSFNATFREIFDPKLAGKAEVCYVNQVLDQLPGSFEVPEGRAKPWGTAHAMLAAKDVINEPFCIINGDDFYGRAAFKSMADYLTGETAKNDSEYCMIGYKINKTLSEFGDVNRGVCICDENDYLVNVTETMNILRNENGKIDYNAGDTRELLDENAVVSMNMWGAAPNIMDYSESYFIDFLKEKIEVEKSEFFIPLVISNLIEDKKAKIKVITTDAQWFGVTYPDDKPDVSKRLNKLIVEGVYPDKLWDI